MKTINIVCPCFNEEENVELLYTTIKEVIKDIDSYNFDILFIDNSSTDKTVEKLKAIAIKDKKLKIIVNNRNFGHIRSPYWGIIQSHGDAVIYLASDFQDPPNLIPEFIEAWESGYKVVFGVKPRSKESFLINNARKLYYSFLNDISNVGIVKNATGFGLYDKEVLDIIRTINDPYPFFRGLVAELGYEIKQIPFIQEKRERGLSKNNIYTLFDIAMLGVVSHSVIPLRIASFFGLILGFGCLAVSIIFILIKIFMWDAFQLGIAPILVGMFFGFGIILIFIGMLGEYIASIHSYVKNRPIVIEKERINF
jgi:glycosyltransferase involved in cell wall biosynthesis